MTEIECYVKIYGYLAQFFTYPKAKYWDSAFKRELNRKRWAQK